MMTVKKRCGRQWFLLLTALVHSMDFAVGFSSSHQKKDSLSTTHRHRHGRPTTPRPTIPPDSFSHQSALEDSIDIREAPDGKGMGAFTTVAIAKGSIVGEYTGEILTRREVQARYWGSNNDKKPAKSTKHDRKWRNSRRRRNQGVTGDYLFDMGSERYIDGEDADVASWCRFANHASPNDGNKCNVEARSKEGRLYFIALMDIETGAELCYDYGEEYWEQP